MYTRERDQSAVKMIENSTGEELSFGTVSNLRERRYGIQRKEFAERVFWSTSPLKRAPTPSISSPISVSLFVVRPMTFDKYFTCCRYRLSRDRGSWRQDGGLRSKASFLFLRFLPRIFESWYELIGIFIFFFFVISNFFILK